MMEPAIPCNEEERLAALRSLNLLDTPPEERFDRLTRLAQLYFRVPISVISLIDADRQWFLSKQGLDAPETPRAVSFCGHAILGDSLFIVPDASQDARFADNPLVAGNPSIRLYAGCPLTSSDGHKLGTICVIDDKPRQLTAEDQAFLKVLGAMAQEEIERHVTEERFRLMVAAAPVALIMANADGEIILANALTESLFGYERAELIGQKVEMLLPDRLRPTHPALRDAFVTNPEPRPMGAGRDLFGRHKNGSEFPIEIGLSPVRTSKGILVMASVVEISERKRQENVIQQKSEALEHSNRDLERFAYVASHDLQEPLRKVQAFGDLLKESLGPALAGEAVTYYEKMIASTVRMRTLVSDLLSLSRVTSAKRPFEPVDLNAMVRGAIDDLESRIKKAGATIEFGELPTVAADAAQMRQLFMNLIGNAVKYRKSDVAPRIQITSRTENDHVVIEIADNGIGFEEKHSDKIFEIFQRLHGKLEYEGTGIGLSIVRRIVDRHSGKIAARSTPGEGSVFTLRLPLRREETSS